MSTACTTTPFPALLINTKRKASVMDRHSWELADVFRLYGHDYRRKHKLGAQQASVMSLIQRCRTAALGGHLYQCDRCGHQHPAYNSCRNRHCPKCQTLAKEQWLADRMAELLPVPYYHTVFTLPHELNPFIRFNRRLLLNNLFASVNEVLQAFAHDPQWRLEGQLGFLAILHTWNQKLLEHYHLHCVIPAGVLQDEGTWKQGRAGYLFNTKSLAKAFRNAYLRRLRKAYEQGQLQWPAASADRAQSFEALEQTLQNKPWITYCKPPFAGPSQVLEYLGRYTHRVAISNHRIFKVEQERVTFTWRDRSDGDRRKIMTLQAEEFIRRFLLHVLPQGFMKMRHFGWMANTNKKRALQTIRDQLDVAASEQASHESPDQIMTRLTGNDITRCPECKQGRLVCIRRLMSPRSRLIPHTPGSEEPHDTS
jgi:hypothetical protein